MILSASRHLDEPSARGREPGATPGGRSNLSDYLAPGVTVWSRLDLFHQAIRLRALIAEDLRK